MYPLIDWLAEHNGGNPEPFLMTAAVILVFALVANLAYRDRLLDGLAKIARGAEAADTERGRVTELLGSVVVAGPETGLVGLAEMTKMKIKFLEEVLLDRIEGDGKKQKRMFICAAWKKLSDGCVARCDQDDKHDGDHLDSVIAISWKNECGVPPLTAQLIADHKAIDKGLISGDIGTRLRARDEKAVPRG
jgi:hypothetical protein